MCSDNVVTKDYNVVTKKNDNLLIYSNDQNIILQYITMTIDINSDFDNSDVNIPLLKEIHCDLDNYITRVYPCLEKEKAKDKIIKNSYQDTYVNNNNNVFISSISCNGIMPGGCVITRKAPNVCYKSTSIPNPKNNLMVVIFTIIMTTLMMITGINIFFKDPYVQFYMSGINKKFKRVYNEPILSCYKNWKKKFVNRTFNRLLIKIGVFVSVFVTIIVMINNVENVVPYLTVSCIGIISWFVHMYWIDYFNDKEIRAYLELLSSIVVFVGKKAQ